MILGVTYMDVTKQKTTSKQDSCLLKDLGTWAISYRLNKMFLLTIPKSIRPDAIAT
jgi:hypothetical protein